MKSIASGFAKDEGWGKSLLDTLLSFFYPNICQVCQSDRATFQEGYVCEACRTHPKDGVQFITRPSCDRCGLPYPGELPPGFKCRNCADLELWFSSAKAAARYSGVVANVTQRYKYNHSLWFEPFLAGLLIEQLPMVWGAQDWDVIVPIPLHAVKQRERGFNQAARLSRRLSAARGIPVRERLLKRARPTGTQTQLSRQERIENMKGAFRFIGRDSLQGERILLIDDVLTTGATASACARELRKNGSGEVSVWTVAREPLRL